MMDKQRGGFRDCPEKPMLQNKRADKMVSRNFPEELAVGIEVELEALLFIPFTCE